MIVAENIILQGVMKCPECKAKLQIRISADDVRLFCFILFATFGAISLRKENIVS